MNHNALQSALDRGASPFETAGATIFSQGAEAGFITGVTFTVNGGWTC